MTGTTNVVTQIKKGTNITGFLAQKSIYHDLTVANTIFPQGQFKRIKSEEVRKTSTIRNQESVSYYWFALIIGTPFHIHRSLRGQFKKDLVEEQYSPQEPACD